MNQKRKISGVEIGRYTTAPFAIPSEGGHGHRPETFRLPRTGSDPYFGLTRSWYYQAEKEGVIRLIRLRQRGRQRGVTLVSYDDVAALIKAAKPV